MISQFLDEASTEASTRYMNFLMSLRGVQSASLSVHPRDARAFNAIREGGYEVARTFLSEETKTFSGDLRRAQDAAQALARADLISGAHTPDAELSDFHGQFVDWFGQELVGQIERDVNALVGKRRELAVQSQITAAARGVDITTAYYGLIAHGREQVQFHFTDRSGRRYPSERFVRQTYRHGLLTFAVETYAMEVASLGASVVEISHPDNNHSYNGHAVSLTGDPAMLQLHEVRSEVFHPNSRAFLKARLS